METRWKIFFRKLALSIPTTLFLWFPFAAAIAIFTSWLFGRNIDRTVVLRGITYSACINAYCWLGFGAFFLALTALGERHIQKTRHMVLPYILISIVCTIAGIATAAPLLAHIANETYTVQDVVRSSFAGLAVSVTIAFGFGYYYVKKDFRTLSHKTTEAELHALKHQMQPHFLFNSLNNLSELIEIDPERASVVTQKLADLYRMILTSSKTKTSSVASEVEIACTYLTLEKVRLGSRLEFESEIADDAKGAHLPSLIIQTLVENAVKHGIAPAPEGGRLTVTIRPAHRGWYYAEVKNSGFRLLENKVSSGTGLANTMQRLDLLYGSEHKFSIQSDSTGSTVVGFFFSGVPVG